MKHGLTGLFLLSAVVTVYVLFLLPPITSFVSGLLTPFLGGFGATISGFVVSIVALLPLAWVIRSKHGSKIGV